VFGDCIVSVLFWLCGCAGESHFFRFFLQWLTVVRFQVCLPHTVFCEIRMPVIVPAKPVIAAKTSLFHVRSNAKCAISMAVKLKAKAMANLTPRTRRSLGDTSVAIVLSVVLRVNARFIQSVNGCAPSAAAGIALIGVVRFLFSRLS